MRFSIRLLAAGLLIVSAASATSAQTYWTYRDGLRQQGYYGTPYDGGPQYGSGGGDQYGYGPGYSYARQAPNRYP
jgi:predicted membrane-bound spermidine synthase